MTNTPARPGDGQALWPEPTGHFPLPTAPDVAVSPSPEPI